MALGYASKGLAGTALGFGIGGTALGLANSGGLLSGLFGGNRTVQNNGCGMCVTPFVSQMELQNMAAYQNAIAGKDAEIAKAQAEVAMLTVSKETDQKISDTYQNLIGIIRAEDSKLEQRIRENELRINSHDVILQKTADSIDRVFSTLNDKMDCCCKSLEKEICCEAERRACADNTIVTYANSTFQPNTVLRTGATGATPTVETESERMYDPLRNNHNVCCCN